MTVDRYREEVGEPRNLPDDHPDRWQWEYQGTRAEKEDLLERLRDASQRAHDAVNQAQESLF